MRQLARIGLGILCTVAVLILGTLCTWYLAIIDHGWLAWLCFALTIIGGATTLIKTAEHA